MHIDLAPINLVQLFVYGVNILIWMTLVWYFKLAPGQFPIKRNIIWLFNGVVWSSVVFCAALSATSFLPALVSGNAPSIPWWVWLIAYVPTQVAGLVMIYELYRER